MTPTQELLSRLESIRLDQNIDAYTLDMCIKIAESMLPKEIWELHRQYDEGWISCLNDKNM